jgi:uncharacterized cupin superfamily protein
MPTITHLRHLRFPRQRDRASGFACASDAARTIAAHRFSLTPRRLPPGGFSFPYHFHHNAEELFLILAGWADLRTPAGIRRLRTGDVAYFEAGAAGAHQLHNPGRRACVYLDLCTKADVDVCEYPDSGKRMIIPGGGIFRIADAVGYFAGEEEPDRHWKAARRRRR